MDRKELFDVANAALKLADSAYSIFEEIAKGVTIEFDPVLHYSIQASLCEYTASINRVALSCALISHEYQRREKKVAKEAEKNAAVPPAAPGEPRET